MNYLLTEIRMRRANPIWKNLCFLFSNRWRNWQIWVSMVVLRQPSVSWVSFRKCLLFPPWQCFQSGSEVWSWLQDYTHTCGCSVMEGLSSTWSGLLPSRKARVACCPENSSVDAPIWMINMKIILGEAGKGSQEPSCWGQGSFLWCQNCGSETRWL